MQINKIKTSVRFNEMLALKLYKEFKSLVSFVTLNTKTVSFTKQSSNNIWPIVFWRLKEIIDVKHWMPFMTTEYLLAIVLIVTLMVKWTVQVLTLEEYIMLRISVYRLLILVMKIAIIYLADNSCFGVYNSYLIRNIYLLGK